LICGCCDSDGVTHRIQFRQRNAGWRNARQVDFVGRYGGAAADVQSRDRAAEPLKHSGRKVCQLQGAGVAEKRYPVSSSDSAVDLEDRRATVLDLHTSNGVGGNVASDIQVSAKCFKGSGSRDWASEGAEADQAGI
jgi:hypothetical protein